MAPDCSHGQRSSFPDTSCGRARLPTRDLESMHASMPHGNNQNIFIQLRDVASKASVCRAETKNSAESSTGGIGVACLVVLGISVCCCFRWLAVARAVTTLKGRP